MTLDDLRAEYDSVKIGPEIWGIVVELASAVARRYPASIYNEGVPWNDESVQDLAQEVVLDRLLEEAQLRYLFDQASDLESWRRLLTLQVRRTIVRRRRRTVLDRLLSRARSLGQEPPFRLESFGSKVWLLSGDEASELVDLTPSRISSLASSVKHIPQLVDDPQSSRASMVYRTSDLRTLLASVVGEVGAISERDLARILELLLTSWLPTFLEDSEQLAERVSECESPVELLEMSEMNLMVATFAASLNETEQHMLLAKSQGVPDAEIAGVLGRSRPWVAQQKQAVLDRVGTEVMGGIDAARHTDAMEMLLVAISDSLAAGCD